MTGVMLGLPVRTPGGGLDASVLPRWRVTGPAGQAVDVVGLGLACCAVEALVAVDDAAVRSTESDLTVLVVAGTVTQAQVSAVAELRRALGATVISYGACADSGGPYWDSAVVARGIGADLFVAGCPPTPAQLTSAIAEVCARG
jgi:NADH-quinone oxidoreductase subunit B